MNFLKDKRKRRQLLCCYGTFLLNGMLSLSIGSLLPYIRDERGLDYAFCGLIVSLHSVGNLIASFAAGILPIAIGKKKSILSFNALFAISYLAIILGENKWILALAFLLTGMARGATSNFGNASINNLAPGSAVMLNGLHAMFSIGAFLFPILLMLLTGANPFNWIYASYFMLAMGMLSWILYFVIPIENDKVEKKKAGDTNYGFLREPLFYFCFLTLFFYLCAEQGVIGWMITYFKDTELLSQSISQITASVLWVMILAGRLLTAFLSAKVRKERLLVAMGIGFVGFFFLLLFGRNTLFIILGIMGFGFSMAGIYPTIVAFAGQLIIRYPMAWNYILTIAGLGSIIMPSIIGKIAETAGLYYGMSSIVAVVLIDLIFILILYRYVNKNRFVVQF